MTLLWAPPSLFYLFSLGLLLGPNPSYHSPSMPYYVANNPTANRLKDMILPPQPFPPPPCDDTAETRPTTQEAAIMTYIFQPPTFHGWGFFPSA